MTAAPRVEPRPTTLGSRDRLVTVTGCVDTGHPAGPHQHILFGGECPHGKPTRYACHTCDFGSRAS